jgi:hypothetical protein
MTMTFQGRDKGLFLQNILNISAIHHIVVLVNERSHGDGYLRSPKAGATTNLIAEGVG